MLKAISNAFLFWLAARGSYRLISRDGDKYMSRYFLYKIFGRNAYLHQVWRSDPDDLHDHPWYNISIVLKGGYREHFADGTYKDRKPGDIVFRDPQSLHRLEVLPDNDEECWTLFLTGKRRRDWGFIVDGEWQNAKDYGRQVVDVRGREFDIVGWFFPKVVWRNGKTDTRV